MVHRSSRVSFGLKTWLASFWAQGEATPFRKAFLSPPRRRRRRRPETSRLYRCDEYPSVLCFITVKPDAREAQKPIRKAFQIPTNASTAERTSPLIGGSTEDRLRRTFLRAGPKFVPSKCVSARANAHVGISFCSSYSINSRRNRVTTLNESLGRTWRVHGAVEQDEACRRKTKRLS